MSIMLRPPTVLQRIVNELLLRISTMKDDEGTGNLWNKVVYGGVSAVPTTHYPAIGLEQGPEDTIEEIGPFQTKEVTFYAEFRFRGTSDLDSDKVFRYYLGRLQSLLFTYEEDSFQLGGLSLNVQESGSNPEIEGNTDTSPGGVLIFKVQYRYKKGDPYKTPEEL